VVPISRCRDQARGRCPRATVATRPVTEEITYKPCIHCAGNAV
jgi:hypothetical protein